ncbi:MAG: hypothetical protein CMO80_02880 [Verrucomicrobiales bacterium]|nr:hypothetical protein [Verrucomicrobiales bacterium]
MAGEKSPMKTSVGHSSPVIENVRRRCLSASSKPANPAACAATTYDPPFFILCTEKLLVQTGKQILRSRQPFIASRDSTKTGGRKCYFRGAILA